MCKKQPEEANSLGEDKILIIQVNTHPVLVKATHPQKSEKYYPSATCHSLHPTAKEKLVRNPKAVLKFASIPAPPTNIL